ncbi:hypothetical protein WJX73_000712 [Symbiochloris irregularis]|uniref:Vesicle transport protein USE1 n=1 Tax=Symbiochloris irregularis TaxID=706552 RepID=A0AAW1NNC5_9CHLO
MQNWRQSPIFHEYLDTLQELLADLEASGGRRCPKAVLKNYEHRVSRIAMKLQPKQVPAYCLPTQPQQHQQQQQSTVPAPPAAPIPPDAALPSSRQAQGAELRQRTAAVTSRVQLGEAAIGRVERQRDVQEALTEDLVGLAAGLKRNVKAMQAAVHDRGRLLEQADTALETNLAGAKQSSKQSNAVYKTNKRSFWFSLLVLLAVGLVFVGMYMFIKVTSMVGYTGKRVPR